MKSTKKMKAIIIAFVLLLITILIGFFWFFSERLNEILEKELKNNLSDTTQSIATVFYTKLDDQIIMLESQARYFVDIDMSDYRTMKDTIVSTKGIGSFKVIGVSGATGSTINYNGKSSGNILHTDYYREAMAGNNAVSSDIIVDEDGEEVIIVAVPIRDSKSGGVKGIIYGSFTKATLNTLVDTSKFSNQSDNIVITGSGDILANDINRKIVPEGTENAFDFLDVKNIEELTRNVLFYEDNYVQVTPIGLHDWYLVSFHPKSTVYKQRNNISILVAILFLGMAILSAIFMSAIVLLYKYNKKIHSVNQRYETVSMQTKDVVFEYDFTKHMICFEGDISDFTTSTAPFRNFNDIDKVLQHIHPEDYKTINAIKELHTNKIGNIKSEIRVADKYGDYHWCSLKSVVERNENGEPLKLIGGLSNIEERLQKEKILTEKAELDSLTGILNKGAFQDHVVDILDSAGHYDEFALFIIDLDNFKAVNDNLGHMVGDRVISDTAKKLCLIFSNFDVVGRIGGDEFSVLLNLSKIEKTKREALVRLKARMINEKMNEIYTSGEKNVHVTSSIGIAASPDFGTDFETLYHNADEALYKSKNNGKNQFNIYGNN